MVLLCAGRGGGPRGHPYRGPKTARQSSPARARCRPPRARLARRPAWRELPSRLGVAASAAAAVLLYCRWRDWGAARWWRRTCVGPHRGERERGCSRRRGSTTRRASCAAHRRRRQSHPLPDRDRPVAGRGGGSEEDRPDASWIAPADSNSLRYGWRSLPSHPLGLTRAGLLLDPPRTAARIAYSRCRTTRPRPELPRPPRDSRLPGPAAKPVHGHSGPHRRRTPTLRPVRQARVRTPRVIGSRAPPPRRAAHRGGSARSRLHPRLVKLSPMASLACRPVPFSPNGHRNACRQPVWSPRHRVSIMDSTAIRGFT